MSQALYCSSATTLRTICSADDWPAARRETALSLGSDGFAGGTEGVKKKLTNHTYRNEANRGCYRAAVVVVARPGPVFEQTMIDVYSRLPESAVLGWVSDVLGQESTIYEIS